jgi:hypothetical protein
MKIIHTLPWFIRGAPQHEEDLRMALQSLLTLGLSEDSFVVLYNQGCLPNEELERLLAASGTKAAVLGQGTNIGIAKARQACFEHIWEHYPQAAFISEIHVDMLFPAGWYLPLIDYLEQTGEPLVSPGILTGYGELQPTGERLELDAAAGSMLETLAALAREEIADGFVHPVVHNAAILRKIGGYDTRFLQGKQGYEDDSLLLGCYYYMGVRSGWRPKCCLNTWVYHATMAQRMSMPDKQLDFALNEQGLLLQYGAYGLKHLAELHDKAGAFDHIANRYAIKQREDIP